MIKQSQQALFAGDFTAAIPSSAKLAFQGTQRLIIYQCNSGTVNQQWVNAMLLHSGYIDKPLAKLVGILRIPNIANITVSASSIIIEVSSDYLFSKIQEQYKQRDTKPQPPQAVEQANDHVALFKVKLQDRHEQYHVALWRQTDEHDLVAKPSATWRKYFLRQLQKLGIKTTQEPIAPGEKATEVHCFYPKDHGLVVCEISNTGEITLKGLHRALRAQICADSILRHSNLQGCKLEINGGRCYLARRFPSILEANDYVTRNLKTHTDEAGLNLRIRMDNTGNYRIEFLATLRSPSLNSCANAFSSPPRSPASASPSESAGEVTIYKVPVGEAPVFC